MSPLEAFVIYQPLLVTKKNYSITLNRFTLHKSLAQSLSALHRYGHLVQRWRNIVFCPFNRYIRLDCVIRRVSRLFWPLQPSVIRRSDPRPWFHVPALSSSDTVKCTPCQIANNIMQMIPNIEDSRNLMQICVWGVTTKQQSNISRIPKCQKNARAETGARGFIAHSNTNKFSRVHIPIEIYETS